MRRPRPRRRGGWAIPAVLTVLVACAPVALAGPGCASVRTALRLPDALDESSGAALGVGTPGVVWTHNDDGSMLFAVDSLGRLLASGGVRPSLRDWEDLSAAPCQAHGSCLYLADTGDNAERRAAGHIKLLRLPEPGLPLGDEPLAAESYPLRLPDGPRDVEALFVLPGERVYLVSKGRNHPVTVYRYPGELRPDTVTLEEVQRLTDAAQPVASQVTGASATPDGERVAIRTYQTMEFYRPTPADTLEVVPGSLVNLRSLRETQGEAVALGPDGLVVLTSEAGIFGGAGAMNLLRCRP